MSSTFSIAIINQLFDRWENIPGSGAFFGCFYVGKKSLGIAIMCTFFPNFQFLFFYLCFQKFYLVPPPAFMVVSEYFYGFQLKCPGFPK